MSNNVSKIPLMGELVPAATTGVLADSKFIRASYIVVQTEAEKAELLDKTLYTDRDVIVEGSPIYVVESGKTYRYETNPNTQTTGFVDDSYYNKSETDTLINTTVDSAVETAVSTAIAQANISMSQVTGLSTALDSKQDVLTFEGTYDALSNKVATAQWVMTQIGNAGGFVIVPELPQASASTTGKIYLVPKDQASEDNIYDEYITVEVLNQGVTTYEWEKIGDTSIDLSDYVQKVESATAGNIATLTQDGSIQDSGVSTNDFISKVADPVTGNIATLTSTGEVQDSGKNFDNFLLTVEDPVANNVVLLTRSGGIKDSGKSLDEITEEISEDDIQLIFAPIIESITLHGDRQNDKVIGGKSIYLDLDVQPAVSAVDLKAALNVLVIAESTVNLFDSVERILVSTPERSDVGNHFTLEINVKAVSEDTTAEIVIDSRNSDVVLRVPDITVYSPDSVNIPEATTMGIYASDAQQFYTTGSLRTDLELKMGIQTIFVTQSVGGLNAGVVKQDIEAILSHVSKNCVQILSVETDTRRVIGGLYPEYGTLITVQVNSGNFATLSITSLYKSSLNVIFDIYTIVLKPIVSDKYVLGLLWNVELERDDVLALIDKVGSGTLFKISNDYRVIITPRESTTEPGTYYWKIMDQSYWYPGADSSKPMQWNDGGVFWDEEYPSDDGWRQNFSIFDMTLSDVDPTKGWNGLLVGTQYLGVDSDVSKLVSIKNDTKEGYTEVEVRVAGHATPSRLVGVGSSVGYTALLTDQFPVPPAMTLTDVYYQYAEEPLRKIDQNNYTRISLKPVLEEQLSRTVEAIQQTYISKNMYYSDNAVENVVPLVSIIESSEEDQIHKTIAYADVASIIPADQIINLKSSDSSAVQDAYMYGKEPPEKPLSVTSIGLAHKGYVKFVYHNEWSNETPVELTSLQTTQEIKGIVIDPLADSQAHLNTYINSIGQDRVLVTTSSNDTYIEVKGYTNNVTNEQVFALKCVINNNNTGVLDVSYYTGALNEDITTAGWYLHTSGGFTGVKELTTYALSSKVTISDINNFSNFNGVCIGAILPLVAFADNTNIQGLAVSPKDLQNSQMNDFLNSIDLDTLGTDSFELLRTSDSSYQVSVDRMMGVKMLYTTVATGVHTFEGFVYAPTAVAMIPAGWSKYIMEGGTPTFTSVTDEDTILGKPVHIDALSNSSYFTAVNGVVIGPVNINLRPFEIDDVVESIDFGSSAVNGETNTALDNLLDSMLEYNSNLDFITDSNYYGVLTAINMSFYQGHGYAIIAQIDNQYTGLYATENANINYQGESIIMTQGFQNLTDGKYTLSIPVQVGSVNNSSNYENLRSWNGTLIGEVASATPIRPFGRNLYVNEIQFNNELTDGTSDTPDQVSAILETLTYQDGYADLVSTNKGTIIQIQKITTGGTPVYRIIADGNVIVFSSEAEVGVCDKGWQNLSDGIINLSSGGNIISIYQSIKWNGNLAGMVV